MRSNTCKLILAPMSRAEAERIGKSRVNKSFPYVFLPLLPIRKNHGQSLDNRYGCGLAIDLLKELQDERLPNTLYSGATVQEEVGLRGARTSAYMIQPDIYFALDASAANDMSGDKNEFGQLGKGVLLRIYDRTMVTLPRMCDFILDIAETHKIPY